MNKEIKKMPNGDFSKIDRYEHLIVVQGSYLNKLSDLIRSGKPRKEMIAFCDKYGIGK